MAECAVGCRKEFHKANFLLDSSNPHDFVTSQWRLCPCTNIFYLVYRLVAAVGIFAIFALQWEKYITTIEQPAEWFIFLTNWSLLMLTLDVIIQCVLAFYAYSLYRTGDGIWESVLPVMPRFLKVSWVITNIATDAGFAVTVLYWSLLYDPSTPIDFNNINTHATNSAYLFLNTFITAMPVRIYHIFHTYIFALVYTLFMVVYQLGFDQPPIYSVVDWKNSWTTSIGYMLMVTFVLSTVVWLLYYGLYRLRLLIAQSLTPRPKNDKTYPLTTEMSIVDGGVENPAFHVSTVYVKP